jgi:hypothetical protein
MKPSLLILLASAYLTSCNHTHNHDDHQHETHEHGDHQHDETTPNATEDHSHQAATVQLNNGARWAANPETTEGINKMMMLIEGAEKAESLDIEEFRSLLHKEFRMIFQKCTMTGEAHEQLHNYLFPLKEQMDNMQGTPEEIAEFKKYLNTYSQYFE